MTRMAEQSQVAGVNAAARQSAAAIPLRELVTPPRYPAVAAVERKLRITVLSGGDSTEREVSLKSGRAIAAALRSLGHTVELADITSARLGALDLPADMVFIALHGSFGEDGRLQAILEQRGIRYCGSGPEASATAMDKVAAKKRFIEAGVPTPRFDVVGLERVEQVLKFWATPVVLKPVAEGSSVDTIIAFDQDTFAVELRRIAGQYGRCLIEQYIRGPELTVGVLGDQALPPIQIRTKRPFYDYEAKYLDDDTEYLFDIDLPGVVLEHVGSLSLRAHQALGCRDFSRVDWMIDGQTHQPYALEVNTIPGFTDHSLLPKAAQRAGLGFAELCQWIVMLTCQR
ncbi:MAG TPA: D-alanine--D-alanine ligase [Phycisphaerae bacterium]|nr:D-alanine--D-alanine ligase [Phycisphaerae bacterium]